MNEPDDVLSALMARPRSAESEAALSEYQMAVASITEEELRLHREYMRLYYPNPAPEGFFTPTSKNTTPEDP